jgi:hypothetical protein
MFKTNNIDLLGLLSFIFGIIGVFIGVLSIKTKLPLYAFRILSLDSIKHPDIRFFFRDKIINNIYAVRYAFWNNGRGEIRNEDLPKSHTGPSIRLSENATILGFETNATNGDGSEYLKESKPNHLSISFDYLNKGDAVFGTIFVTSNDNKWPKVKFIGAIKGAKIQKGSADDNHKGFIFFVIIIALTLTMALLSHEFSCIGDYYVNHNYKKMVQIVVLSIFLLLFIYIFIDLLLGYLKRIDKRLNNYLSSGVYE